MHAVVHNLTKQLQIKSADRHAASPSAPLYGQLFRKCISQLDTLQVNLE